MPRKKKPKHVQVKKKAAQKPAKKKGAIVHTKRKRILSDFPSGHAHHHKKEDHTPPVAEQQPSAEREVKKKEPAAPDKSDKEEIKLLVDEYESIRDEIHAQRKKGLDVYLEDIMSMAIPFKIRLYEATRDQKDLEVVKKKLQEVRQMLNDRIAQQKQKATPQQAQPQQPSP